MDNVKQTDINKLYELLIDKESKKLKVENQQQKKLIVAENYKQFLCLSKEYNNFYKDFADVKVKFSQYENNLKFLNDEIQEMKNNSQGTDTNEEMLEQYLKSEEEEIQHKESGDYDIQEVKMDQIEENVNDTLDYLNLSIVEHNYAEALDKLNMIQDLQNSTKFSLCLNKLEIRKSFDIYFQMLCDAIITDYESNLNKDNKKNLIEIMLKLNQSQRIMNSFLNIQDTQIQSNLIKQIEQTVVIESESIIKLSKSFFKDIEDTYKQFELSFADIIKKNPESFSFLELWILKQLEKFHEKINSFIFSSNDIDDILDLIQSIIKATNDFGENKINFTFLVERMFVPDLNERLDSILNLYLKKVYNLLENDQQQLCYQMLSFEYLDQYDEKLYSDNLKPVLFQLEFNAVTPEQLAANQQENSYDTKTTFVANLKDLNYKQLLDLCKLKVSKYQILFWNIMYYFVDHVIQQLQVDNYQLFSTQFIAALDKKSQKIIDQLCTTVKNQISKITNITELQVLSACANMYSMFTLSKIITAFVSKKLAQKMQLQSNVLWRGLIQKLYIASFDIVAIYWKFRLLEDLPRLLVEIGRSYFDQSIDGNEKSILIMKSASPFMIRVAALMETIFDNMKIFMTREDVVFHIEKLFNYLLYIFEYIIYWDYHNKGKKFEIFFLKKQEVEKLSMNFTQIDQYMENNAIKLSSFSLFGINQFVFDLQMISVLYNQGFSQELKSKFNMDQYCNKIISCYCNEKKFKAGEFYYKFEQISNLVLKYYLEGYPKDKLTLRGSNINSNARNSEMNANSNNGSNNNIVINLDNNRLSQQQQNVQQDQSKKERIFTISDVIF